VEKQTTAAHAASRPDWTDLEAWVRGRIQEWIQELLEEEVSEVLGRRKSERRAAVVSPGYRESTAAWSEMLRDLKRRGMNTPALVVGDGHLGIWGALRNVYPEAEEARCWNHYADLRIMPTMDRDGGHGRSARRESRHNHRLSRNARSESAGR
jgi:transposase-like protein